MGHNNGNGGATVESSNMLISTMATPPSGNAKRPAAGRGYNKSLCRNLQQLHFWLPLWGVQQTVTCLVAINQKILNGSSNAYYLHISPRREYINHENCLLFFPWLSYVLKKALEFDLWYGFKHIYPPHRIFFATQKNQNQPNTQR